MAMSNTKRIINELCTLETESAAIIPRDSYYILKIRIEASKKIKESYLSDVAEKLLLTDPNPSSVYYSNGLLLLIFPATEDTEDENDTVTHQLEGNHDLIVSKYCMLLSKLLPTDNISVQIIHLLSKTKVFSYLSYIIFTEYQNMIVKLSEGEITVKELNFRTDNELKNILLTKHKVDLDKIPAEHKYGVVMNVKRVKNKVNYTRMSEAFDARDTKKYISFIFS